MKKDTVISLENRVVEESRTAPGASLQVREAVLRAETQLLHLPEDKIINRIYKIDRILELPGRQGLKALDHLTPSPPGSQRNQCPSVVPMRGCSP